MKLGTSTPNADPSGDYAWEVFRRVVALPDQPAVGADYGLTVMNGASPAAHRLTLTILSPDGKPSSPITGSALPPSPDRKADDQELRRQTARRYSRSLRIVE